MGMLELMGIKYWYLFRAQKNKDERSQSIIKLNDSTLLYYKEIERWDILLKIYG